MEKLKTELGESASEDNLKSYFSTEEKWENEFYPYNIDDVSTRLSVQNLLSFAMSKPHIR